MSTPRSPQGYDCITFKSEAELFMSAGKHLLAQLRERTANHPGRAS